MADVELTELQTRIYEVLADIESISKKKLSTALNMQVRALSSPLKAMVDRGVLVTDEYGDYSIAAGVREEVDDGYVSVPAPPAVAEPPLSTGEPVGELVEVEEEDLYGTYWKQHPEELVTFYGEEGLDALKRHSLVEAMKSAVGVGQKALDAALHWFEIDEEVRRDPPSLMRALEDAGVKHSLVGRIARETFLPEKRYSEYLKPNTEPFIERRRVNHRERYPPRGRHERHDEFDDEFDDELDYQRAPRTQRREDPVPVWAEELMRRLDVVDGGGSYNRNRSHHDHPRVVLEPVLDEFGNPVPDPENPGQWLERRVVYESPVAQAVSSPNSGNVDDLRKQIDQLRETLAEHETEKKINTALSPLVAKIQSLEKRDPVAKTGMTDEQFKMQTEKEIYQDMSSSVESTIANLVEPILEGVTEVQKMQAMRDMIELERRDQVTPGTYLKYLAGGEVGTQPVTKERVGGTIDRIKSRTRGAI
jgi:hypothetical protein